ncbi:MAG: hypothetical protein NTU44_07130 [Bacteroidetes bacterium]|nr:hypothetical protein [Bacteroidota bacterium]
MYITNMTHHFDDEGNIAKGMPKQARELAGFQAMIVDAFTQQQQDDGEKPSIPCFKKNCKGVIDILHSIITYCIHWSCPVCQVGGILYDWRGTKWDNTSGHGIKTTAIEKAGRLWFNRLTDNIVIPFSAVIISGLNEVLPKDTQVIVTKITDYFDQCGVMVEITVGRECYTIPLCELAVSDILTENFKPVDEYLSWWFSLLDEG